MYSATNIISYIIGWYSPIYLIVYFILRWKKKKKLKLLNIIFSGTLSYILSFIIMALLQMNNIATKTDTKDGIIILVFFSITYIIINQFMKMKGLSTDKNEIKTL
ncbi:hypothetical protein LJ207_11615 [Halanaerobium sp. Z-7514]|uniref:Uncharacterized protein n=1 Tax=Halanaerobium polyolivorans TaxID=2886943 RepID=A0AAW4X2G2_9FIRM|nr:hypothetical protein [Halanaerobium polyolivorans]MCC3145962.1 hypothetical protein [Halanaerobium polyolivorans]